MSRLNAEHREGPGPDHDRARPPAPGRTTLTAALTPMRRAEPTAWAPSGARDLDLEGPTAAAPVADRATTSVAVASGLPVHVLDRMEHAFGADFGDVRFHPSSSEAASRSAQAFARGKDVHVAPGLWDPHGAAGQELIGHELAHVVQQAQGRVGVTTQYKGLDANRDEALELEADRWGAAAARGEIAVHAGIAAGATTVAQLKIGFEMQSTWTILRIGKNAEPDSKDVVYRGAYFKIEVDRGKHAELEIVTYPLADRAAFDGAMFEIEYVVAMLSSMKGKTFVMPAGNGWVADIEIQRTSETPIFRLQYTEGVTVEKIPSLIQQLHPAAWRDLPGAITGEPEQLDQAKAKRKVDRPDETKLRGLIVAICMYLGDAARWRPEKKDDTEKYAHPLMARTDFHAIYAALDADEQAEFQAAFAKGQAAFQGYALDAQVYGAMDKDLTVREWLASIVDGRPLGKKAMEPKDLMSPPPGFEQHARIDAYNATDPDDPQMKYAMGMYALDEDDLALFEARQVGSPQGQNLAGSAAILGDMLVGTSERAPGFAAKKPAEGGDEDGVKRQRLARGAKDKAAKAKADEQAKKDGKGGKDDLLGDKAKGKLGADYLPTAMQVQRMGVHRRRLDWVAPDGMCMLGALSRVSGVAIATIRDNVRAQLAIPGSAAVNFLTEFAPEHSPEDVRRVLGNLVRYWNDPAADAVLPVAALVLGIGVTVIEPDGTPLPVHGGGTILLHVNNPVGHYHSTLPL